MKEIDFFRGRRCFSSGGREAESIYDLNLKGVDEQALNCFLYLGYVPGDRTLFDGVSCNLVASGLSEHVSRNEDYLNQPPSFSLIKNLLLEYINKNIDCNADQVVPLSGGMDSRIVLGLLREFFESHKIHTYTFGVPGAYDFDIANMVAQYAGTKHVNFSASDTTYDVQGLIRAARQSDANTEVFHPLVLNRVSDYYGSNANYWSGFAGDLVGGGFGKQINDCPAKQQVADYENRGIHYFDKSGLYQTVFPLMTDGEKFDGFLSDVESCFWENHVERYTSNHIFRNDMKVYAPFLSFPFLKFFFSLSIEDRQDKKLFNDIFSVGFPGLFNFPTKDYGYSLSRRKVIQPFWIGRFFLRAIAWRLCPSICVHPSAAYIDMRNAINFRKDVSSCVDLLLNDLSTRGIVDGERVKSILSGHRSGDADFTKDIINLASLEVILKAAEE